MEKRQTTINGRNYQLMLPPVRQAMPLCTRFTTLIGPAIGSLGMEAGKGGWAAFASSMRGIDPDKADALLMDAVMISTLCFDGQQICDELNFERHFSQYRSDLYLVCAWAVWECVRDFLPKMDGLIQWFNLKEKLESLSRMDG